MEVILTSEYEKSLREFIYNIVQEEFQQARNDIYVSDKLYNQSEIAKLFNTSTTTVRQWEKEGMPCGKRGMNRYYDYITCKQWILSQNN
ncbi:MerR family transcriptional regulator [Melissococcus plutonius]|uniref:MerR family transcriptional regulator n=1 Tax=Melissococcus plutonius TaxID=33970 RepID=UPI0021E5E690|nr:MerR family transcriptional regulator [Melissococcus plutonius]MCV2499505.1 MerR family transcriptional regulator [Melissococcus plutonius]MCV2505843.1 MerR family transcriptional regulator [Melissococcus plutonius]